MRLRREAVPSPDPVSAPSNSGVTPEADALAWSISQLAAEVQTLSDRAARLQQAGHPEAEWLLARLQSHCLASPDLSGPVSRMIIQATAAAVEEHRAALARDVAELERVEAAVEAARKEEAQREARARREVQAAAARSTPAPAAPVRSKTAGQALGRMTAPAAGRSSSRIPVQTQVDLSSDSNVFTGFSTNLSEGGVFVATVNLLPVGTAVDLTFSLPGKVRITVQGEVRWTREVDDRAPDVFPGVGVRFVDLSPEAAQALHRFVADREPLFYPE